MQLGALVQINWLIENIGECLLISSLPGKASRMLVDIARLAERFNVRSRSRAWYLISKDAILIFY